MRADPRTHRLYRAAIAVSGGALVLLGLLSGPLPGPGGVPLVLAGLAVLASEFPWARRLLDRARLRLHALSAWAGARPVWLRWAGGAAVLAAVVGAAYAGLVLAGVPPLLPDALSDRLAALPGVEGVEG
ncbi:TIGR02611 family protein [Quadrisphaera sp. DSM 44207]|nr:TIGR02611 family protein [Quadrisphaera sp. DSM 44207]